MNPLTLEWIEKAEADFITAQREMRARKNPNYDATCFHSQQCVEKCMKAILHNAAVPFPKTHNLTILLELLLPIDPTWELMRAKLARLSGLAVSIRYPGESADKGAARESLQCCKEVRKKARHFLELEG